MAGVGTVVLKACFVDQTRVSLALVVWVVYPVPTHPFVDFVDQMRVNLILMIWIVCPVPGHPLVIELP